MFYCTTDLSFDHAQVYHPNIDMEGNICLNILREDWKPVLSINSVVFGLNYLFLVRPQRSYQSFRIITTSSLAADECTPACMPFVRVAVASTVSAASRVDAWL